MIYKKTKDLNLIRVPWWKRYWSIPLFFFLGFSSFSLFSFHDIQQSYYESYTVEHNSNLFSPQALKRELSRLNLRFPHIAYAQSILETDSFRSRIFIENNNLFGMKEAKNRPTTALGTQYNHAYYHNWEESVMDYALWCSKYGNVREEWQFYQILNNYAEDSLYVKKVKKLY